MVQQNAGCFVIATAVPHDQKQSTLSWLSAHTQPNSHVKDTNSCVEALMHQIMISIDKYAAAHPGLENPS
jgi:prephenate dehydrogenase